MVEEEVDMVDKVMDMVVDKVDKVVAMVVDMVVDMVVEEWNGESLRPHLSWTRPSPRLGAVSGEGGGGKVAKGLSSSSLLEDKVLETEDEGLPHLQGWERVLLLEEEKEEKTEIEEGRV